MTFKTWMKTTDASPAAVARDLGLSRMMIHNYMNNVNYPTLKVAVRIEDYTGGKVTLYDWIHGESELDTLL